MHSEHFTELELSCLHCGKNECRPELLYALETFRTAVGRPVMINDAYRCVIHSVIGGGSKDSVHVLGMAADIRVEGLTAGQLEQVAARIPMIRGIGRNDHANYLHIDIRHEPARWCYNLAGKQIKWHPLKNTA